MKVWLIIPVEFKGEQLEFKAKEDQCRYGIKFKVKVNGVDIMFKPDKEGKYRAAVKPELLEGTPKIEIDLLQVIARTLEAAVLNF